MKKVLSSIAAIGCLAMIATAAQANDGQINFAGAVTATTCTVSVDGATTSPATVTLPTVAQSALVGVGTVAGYTGFTIALANCLPAAGITKAQPYFEGGYAAVDSSNGRLINLSAPLGDATVNLQLLDNNSPIYVGGDQTAGTKAIITGGSATFNYGVRYYANSATTTPGPVTSYVTYSISYQ